MGTYMYIKKGSKHDFLFNLLCTDAPSKVGRSRWASVVRSVSSNPPHYVEIIVRSKAEIRNPPLSILLIYLPLPTEGVDSVGSCQYCR